MFFMYADESGDTGLVNSPSRYFVLTGLVVHELRWQDTLDTLINFRQRMKKQFGLRLREELHSACLISRPGRLVRIKRNDRLTIIRAFADELSSIPDLNVINVIVDKQNKPPTYDVFEMAWKALLQRFENTMCRRNFTGPINADDRGMVFPDFTADRKLTDLLRQMRKYNPVPSQFSSGINYRNLMLTRVTEDPSFRDSSHSYFVQAADLAAFLIYQGVEPNAYMKKKSGSNYYKRLEPILCKVAAPRDPYGIVRL